MAELNEVCIPAGRLIDGVAELGSIELALANSSVKYNTTLQVDEDSIFFAPEVIADAVAMVGCEIAETCDFPEVLEAEQYTFNAGCKLCLNELDSNTRKAFGMSTGKPTPTPALSARYENRFVQNILTSTRKINWLGDKSYIAADLANADLLPNYKKADGIWTKLVALSPAPANVTIAKNAELTKKLQTTWTGDEVLDVIDEMLATASETMKLVVETQKKVWITVEMYDALIREMKRDSFNLCCVGTLASQVEGGVEVSVIMYGDLMIIKYDEFSAAIRDLAPPAAGRLNAPNRAVLALGLPIINYIEQPVFSEDFKQTTGMYEASHGITTAIVDPFPADFYVTAY